MDLITYAKKNGLPTKYIPPAKEVGGYLTHQVLAKSRQKTSISTAQDPLPFNIVSEYSSAESPRIKYGSPFNDRSIASYINGQPNLMDKILSLNPKQVGVVNPYIDICFDVGNQLHYLTAKFSPIGVFDTPDDLGEMSIDSDGIRFFEQNPQLYSYGDLNLNPLAFSSLLYRFTLTNDEKYGLSFNENLNELYDTSNLRSIPYKLKTEQEFNEELLRQNNIVDELDGTSISGSIYEAIPSPISIDKITSPLNFAYTEFPSNENFILDKTHPLLESYAIKIKKNIHYSSSGTDITYLNTTTGLTALDELLKRIYSWKSCLLILEYEQTDYDIINPVGNKYELILMVGIKTRKYKITEKIDKLFYVAIGDNYINDTEFSNKDIFLLSSSLKQLLSTYKPDSVYFLDISDSEYGNICPNGLVLGMQSELQEYVINLINKQDNKLVKTQGKIENLYELFKQI